jgi:hypothetical protein
MGYKLGLTFILALKWALTFFHIGKSLGFSQAFAWMGALTFIFDSFYSIVMALTLG